ncbi:MAG: 3-oxoacyl-[acyl-carrier protein] reductase [Chthoniobacter sp.]|jgi:NAD(P)-dependent dehydrogenase (short-subunit alcohol dehydrogenase family)|nr:3-oxoacyl-[acyl-carrier protein] reductase [Chthoniobacter sp.]
MNGVALITGSSRGIGRGIALELARLGKHDLVINYAGNEAAARECADLCRAAGAARVEIVQGDVSKTADRQRMIEFVRERCGRLDVLVNNAGITSPGRADILEATEASFDTVMGINLRGPFFLTQLAARLIIDSAPIEGRPRAVINLSSISAFAVSTNRGDYCITKAGIGMMTQLWAVRLAEFGIAVFEIQPGVVESDMTGPVKQKYDALFAQGFTPINRWGHPSDIAKAVAAVVLGHFPYSTGQVFQVDGGFHLRTL